MSAIIAALYFLCILALPAFAIFVLLRGRRADLNGLFAWLSLALWLWVITLFAFSLQISPGATLVIGRLNFAAAVPAVTLGYAFVLAVAGRPLRFPLALWLETALLTLLSMFSGWIDAAELIVNGVHVTHYGQGFPLYVAHVVLYIVAMLYVSLRPAPRTPVASKRQLRFIGYGILATAAVALFTNVLLPYGFGNFAWIHVGAVSVALFLAGAAGAVTLAHLFDIHLIIRATVIFAGLIALALELYELALTSLARLLPISNPSERDFAATVLVLVVSAFTSDSIKKWLGRLVDRSVHRYRA